MARDDDVSHPPRKPPDHEHTSTDRAGPDRAGPDRARPKKVVLLVEDVEADRALYGGLLWYNGYDVVYAVDGEAGIRKALEVEPDLILLDLMLPAGPDGIEVARRLRKSGVEAPIIALSARTEEELGLQAREAGMVAYLEKPIDPFAVVREVSRRIGYTTEERGRPGGG